MVVQSKAFSKVVKLDNAEVPVYLWNGRVKTTGITKEQQDAALDGFRKLGYR
jgi:hypothetical protein